MFLLEQINIKNYSQAKFLQKYVQNLSISVHLKKYKMCRFGITHEKKVANRRIFRYCLVHILRLLIS